ncbi:MAG: putative sulfate exporter family transporter, partial [Bacteroidales bacterium]|nr:putative sulfate exporter family transporter [Bacteroidales bacterium]
AEQGQKKPWYKSIPTFILWFIVAILFNTYILSNPAVLGDNLASIGSEIGGAINKLAKHLITLSLFFIGASLTKETLKAVGLKPLIQGILLWIIISCVSLAYILFVA